MVYYDDFEKRRKEVLGIKDTNTSSIIPSTYSNNISSFEQRRKQIIESKPITPSQKAAQENKKEQIPSIIPTVTKTTPTPKKEEGFNLNSLVDTIKKAVVSAIPQLAPKVTAPEISPISAQPNKIMTPTQPLKTLESTPTQVSGQSAGLTTQAQTSPTMQNYQSKAKNIFDSMAKFSPIDTAITAGQEYIAKSAQDFTEGKTKQLPIAVYNTAFYQAASQKLLDIAPSPIQNLMKGHINAVSSSLLGSSEIVNKTLNEKFSAPKDIAGQTFYNIGGILGSINTYMAGGQFLKAVGITKMSMPILMNVIGQLSASPTTTFEQRLKKIPNDTIAGYIASMIPGSDKFISTKTFVGAGETGAVFGLNAFVNALIEGLPVEEAAKVMNQASLVGALFHVGSVGVGRLGAKTFGETKVRGQVLTPEQLRTQANGTDIDTKQAAFLNELAMKAEIKGKNIAIAQVDIKQGELTKKVGLETTKKVAGAIGVEVPTISKGEFITPEGRIYKGYLVDTKAPIQQLTGETPGTKPAEVPSKELTIVKTEVQQPKQQTIVPPNKTEVPVITQNKELQTTIENKIQEQGGNIKEISKDNQGYTTIQADNINISFNEKKDTIDIVGFKRGETGTTGDPTKLLEQIKEYASSQDKTITATKIHGEDFNYWKKVGFDVIDISNGKGIQYEAIWEKNNTLQEKINESNKLQKLGEDRLAKAEGSMQGLKPAYIDWMTNVERERFQTLNREIDLEQRKERGVVTTEDAKKIIEMKKTLSKNGVKFNSDASMTEIQNLINNLPSIKPKIEIKKLTLAPSKESDAMKVNLERMQLGLSENVLKMIKGEIKGYERPLISRSDFNTFATNSRDFKANPILKVDSDKNLVFKGKNFQFKIKPEQMNLSRDRLQEGDEITVDINSLKGNGKSQQMRVYNNGGVYADREPFAELEQIANKVLENGIKPIEFPEALRLAEELMGGNRPLATSSKRGNWRGIFRSGGLGQIELKTGIFKTPGQAAKTLSHEIGHLIDYLPDKTMARGNILGRIGSLRKFMRSIFSNKENEAEIDRIFSEVKLLQEERRALKDENGDLIPANKEKDLALLREIRPLNKQIKELQKESIELKPIRKELMDLSAKWRPIEGGTGTAKDIENDAYRSGSDELYADAISVLFNDPARLKTEAPLFWESFFNNLDNKPDAKDSLFKLYDLLSGDPEKIFRARDEEMSKSFKKAEDAFYALHIEKQKRITNLVEQIRILFDNKNQAIINKTNQAINMGVNIPAEKNPIYSLGALNYTTGKIKQYIEDSFQPVFEKAQSVNDGWNTLGKILQLERTIYERGELANPGGYDPKTAQDQLNALEKYTDPEDWKKIQEAKESFREAVQKSILEAEKAGYYSPEMIALMKANPAYATYQVVDYLDTYVSAGVKQGLGTLKDIANPATSTVMKTISLIKAIERNNVKKDVVGLLNTAFSGEITPSKTRFNGKTNEVMETREKDKGTIKVIENGKLVGYDVDKKISDTFNVASNETVMTAAKLMRTISLSNFYRPLFTSFNLGFQSFNFARDFQRYWKNLPDYTFGEAITSYPRAIYRYLQAAPHALKRATGKEDPLIKEMYDSKILGMSFNDINKDSVDPEEQEIIRVMQGVGVLEKERQSKLWTPIVKVLDAIEIAGNFIESLPKIAGYIELKGKMPEAQLANFIRTKIGSPDFRTAGSATPITNNIFLFSNAIKEGMKSDLQVLTGRSEGGKQSQSGFWWKTVVSTFLPKIIMAAMSSGLLGELLKKQIENVSEYDKSNYTIIPMGIDENGKTIYMRIPQDETSRLMGAIFWKGMNIATDPQNIKVKELLQILDIGAGQLPNLAPSFTSLQWILQYIAGQNPYDSFRGRNVIPDKEFTAGYKYSFPIFLDKLSQLNGMGMVIPSYNPDNPNTLERVLNLPLISNIVGRWIKVSDYGVTEKLSEQNKDIEAQAAERSIQKRETIKKYVKKYKENPSQGLVNVEKELIGEVFQIKGTATTAQKQGIAILKKQFRVQTQTGENKYLDQYFYSTTNEEKINVLSEMKKNSTSQEFKNNIDKLRKQGLVSNQVLKKVYHP